MEHGLWGLMDELCIGVATMGVHLTLRWQEPTPLKATGGSEGTIQQASGGRVRNTLEQQFRRVTRPGVKGARSLTPQLHIP